MLTGLAAHAFTHKSQRQSPGTNKSSLPSPPG
jgi:hypothetical protein